MIRTQEAIEVRGAGPADRAALREFHEGLSPTTRYRRFFGGGPGAVSALVGVMTGERGADVVVATEMGEIIGHGMAAGARGMANAIEIGVVVTDARQHRGVGAAMVRELVAHARDRGVTTLVMEVLAENRDVLAMIEDHWPTARHDRSSAYVTVYAPLI